MSKEIRPFNFYLIYDHKNRRVLEHPYTYGNAIIDAIKYSKINPGNKYTVMMSSRTFTTHIPEPQEIENEISLDGIVMALPYKSEEKEENEKSVKVSGVARCGGCNELRHNCVC
jgi:hypothetical protein